MNFAPPRAQPLPGALGGLDVEPEKLRELPPSCEVEDLISCGIESHIGAIDRYDPAKGAGLEPYLWTRIHGSVLDELRRRDWAPAPSAASSAS